MLFEDILYRIGPSNVFLILVFLITFIVLHYSLIRVFNKQPASGSILAILLAFGITYGIWWNGFNIQGFLQDLGITSDTLYFAAPILVLIKMIIIAWLFGISTLFIILGGLLMVLSYWAYEKTIVFIIGSVIMMIGLFALNRKLKKRKNNKK